jgi:DNA-binding CsgD family transcriptional regulator
MTPIHTPPGMLSRCMEFFLNKGELQVITKGKLTPFRDAPLSVLEQLNDILEDRPLAMQALDEMGLQYPMDRLEQFARCWFGDYDTKADICQDGEITSEYYECGSRGKCPYEGKLCPGLKTTEGFITPREVEVVKLICEDLSDKLIAQELGCATNTVKVHVAHILRKLGVYTRVGIAMWAKEKGVA